MLSWCLFAVITFSMRFFQDNREQKIYLSWKTVECDENLISDFSVTLNVQLSIFVRLYLLEYKVITCLEYVDAPDTFSQASVANLYTQLQTYILKGQNISEHMQNEALREKHLVKSSCKNDTLSSKCDTQSPRLQICPSASPHCCQNSRQRFLHFYSTFLKT